MNAVTVSGVTDVLENSPGIAAFNQPVVTTQVNATPDVDMLNGATSVLPAVESSSSFSLIVPEFSSVNDITMKRSIIPVETDVMNSDFISNSDETTPLLNGEQSIQVSDMVKSSISLHSNPYQKLFSVKRKPCEEPQDESKAEMRSQMLLSENDRDGVRLRDLLDKSYDDRRRLIQSKAPISVIRAEYPAIFSEDGLLQDYQRLKEAKTDTMRVCSY